MWVVELGQRGDVAQVGPVAEHGRRRGEPPGRLGQAREAQRHRAGDRLRPDLVDARRVLGRGREALTLQRVEEGAHEERVSAGRLVAGRDGLGLRLHAELLLGELRDRCVAERERADQERVRIRDELRDEHSLVALLRRS